MAVQSTLSAMRNIGATVERRLNEIGVFCREDLEGIGPAAAYRKMKLNYPNATLSRCYYLYSLEGALRDVHWDKLPDATKRQLSEEAGLDDFRSRTRLGERDIPDNSDK